MIPPLRDMGFADDEEEAAAVLGVAFDRVVAGVVDAGAAELLVPAVEDDIALELVLGVGIVVLDIYGTEEGI